MKTSKTIAVIGAVLLACAGAGAQAQTITWDPATTITTDTDVSTAGTLVDAYYFSGTPDGTAGYPSLTTSEMVNGVTFTRADVTTAGFTSAYAANNGYYFTPAGSTGYTGSDAYTTVLSGGWYDYTYQDPNSPNMTLTLTGLTSGDSYQFEWWTNDSRGGRTAWLTSATAGNTVTLSPEESTGQGQFAIGTFTASGSSEVIDFNSNAVTQVNAYEVRDLGVAETPEPSTVALIGLGGLGLAFLAVRRRHSLV